MDIAVTGRGRVGSALAELLSRAGHRIVDEPRDAELVLITTPDDRIASVCAELAEADAFHPGQVAAHASGATGLDALAPAKVAGADLLSLHPLQTFPDAASAVERFPGSAVAVTAESDEVFELGERLARDVGAIPFRLPDDAKPLYHAAAVFSSNYVVTVLGLAEQVFREAGLDDPLPLAIPLVRSSIDAVDRLGPAEALTGPAVRGDAGTIEANLDALGKHAPNAVASYIALCGAALDLAERSGRLTPTARAEVQVVLDRWT